MATDHAMKPTSTPPPYSRPKGCEDLILPFNIGSGRTIYAGFEGADRLRLRLFKRLSDQHLIGRAWFGQGTDGPPGHAHGGVVAYILDEAMGAAAWASDYPAVAARLDFTYLRMSPMWIDLEIEAWISKATRGRLLLSGEVRMPNGETCVTSHGEFSILEKSKVKMLEPLGPPEKLLENPRLKWAKE